MYVITAGSIVVIINITQVLYETLFCSAFV